ncbi:hypothetical protein ACET3X_002283 [Alternaria dauci]|uniref:Uncharacterized protein n=1 Tax=Alternaria dauci TaxID=48095 RepID=A0ABR3US35_9PLEO
MADSPYNRSHMPPPNSRPFTPLSQGRHGLGISYLDSEEFRDSPFSEVSAHNLEHNHGYNGNRDRIPPSVNYRPTAPRHSSFSAMSPNILRPSAPDGARHPSSASNPHISDLSSPFTSNQRAQGSYRNGSIPFSQYPTPSDRQEFSPDTPFVMARPSHVQHLEDSRQAHSTNVPSQASNVLPQVRFGHPQETNHLPLPFTTLLPPGPPPSGPPYTSSSFNQPSFPNGHAVAAYMSEVIWRPSMGMYGVPTTEAQKGYYVRNICLGLVNLYNLWDDSKYLLTASAKFADTGIWSDPKDIEVTAHIVVNNAMRIHEFGVTGVAFRRSAEFESLNAEDMDFTFPQRMHYLARLFYHSKVAADNVMSGRNIAKYVALPITSLRRLPFFEDEWSAMSQVNRVVQTEVLPYPDGLIHPSPTEQAQLLAHIATLPSLVKDYMGTGGHMATLSQKYLSPNELAYAALLSFQQMSHKRPVDGDQGSGMGPAAKRFRTGGHASFDSSVRDSENQEPDSVIDTVEA